MIPQPAQRRRPVTLLLSDTQSFSDRLPPALGTRTKTSLKPCIAQVATAAGLGAILSQAPCIRSAAVRPPPTHRGWPPALSAPSPAPSPSYCAWFAHAQPLAAESLLRSRHEAHPHNPSPHPDTAGLLP